MKPVEKTVHELCLVCGGERWVPDLLDPKRSLPCPYCDDQGWVTVALPSLGEKPPAQPDAEDLRKEK